jgi:hypothetical protein
MLHKTSRLTGYHIVTSDEESGHVDDFLIDEQWQVRYLVVDTSNWIGGESVLVPSSAVSRVDSPAQKIYLKMSRAEVEGSPSVDTANIELVETLPPVTIL